MVAMMDYRLHYAVMQAEDRARERREARVLVLPRRERTARRARH
jgi:hypothetical protein